MVRHAGRACGWPDSGGFVKWFAEGIAAQLTGVSPSMAVLTLLVINFFGHYLFASITAHVTAMIPVLLAVGSAIPGVNIHALALGLCLQLGSWASSRPTPRDRARCTTAAAICRPLTTGAWAQSSA